MFVSGLEVFPVPTAVMNVVNDAVFLYNTYTFLLTLFLVRLVVFRQYGGVTNATPLDGASAPMAFKLFTDTSSFSEITPQFGCLFPSNGIRQFNYWQNGGFASS